MANEKAATNGDGFSFWGLKKRGRKEDSRTEQEWCLLRERQRLTASAAFLDYKIPSAFEQEIKRIKTNRKQTVKKN